MLLFNVVINWSHQLFYASDLTQKIKRFAVLPLFLRFLRTECNNGFHKSRPEA